MGILESKHLSERTSIRTVHFNSEVESEVRAISSDDIVFVDYSRTLFFNFLSDDHSELGLQRSA